MPRINCDLPGAARCGDAAMVAKLVALGTDVSCRDSVGGTPMHHAAMAGKQVKAVIGY